MSNNTYVNYDNARPTLRLPREGWIDLTYRCNNHCRHCWLQLPVNDKDKERELSFNEIRQIADEARQVGCNHWSISGGEPMLRSDFSDIFDYLTHRASNYSLNTNGTLITPALAKLLTRNGNKMVAIYGADADVHDKITRSPGSFEACIRGCAYLKEVGASFTVQLIPMRDNYHQLDEMIDLAKSLSSSYRIGAAWLYLSAKRQPQRNREIIRQRLSPEEVVAIDPARPVLENYIMSNGKLQPNYSATLGEWLKQSCIMKGRQFHIDPYGGMSFCSFMKDPSLRFSLKEWSFHKIWNELIPSCNLQNHNQDEYADNCGSCNQRETCHWCPAYAYLEKGRLSAPIEYLCKIAKERRLYKEKWMKNNYQLFEIAGMTVHVDSDIPLTKHTFAKRFDTFRVNQPGDDHLYISHHFSLPDLAILKNDQLVYNKNPWAIYRYNRSWIYLGLGSYKDHSRAASVSVFNDSHTHVRIYHQNDSLIRNGNLGALTGFPSDQIMLSQVLADRKGCYLHSSGLILNGHGILFVGPSGAGKSTLVKLLKGFGQVLCDDRNIIRRWPDGYRVHGTWSHGELPLVSNKAAPLKAILFIEQAQENLITPVTDKKYIMHQLLNRVIKPFCTISWWDKTIGILSDLSNQVPTYRLLFTKEPTVVKVIEEIVGPLEPLETDLNSSESLKVAKTPDLNLSQKSTLFPESLP